MIGPGFDVARLAQSDDYVRAEVLEAFNLDKQIVPVLVDDASMPRPNELPPALEMLSYRNAAPLRPDPDFDLDAETGRARPAPSGRAAPSTPGHRRFAGARRRAVNNPGATARIRGCAATLDHRGFPVGRPGAAPGDRRCGRHGRGRPRDHRRRRPCVDRCRPGAPTIDHVDADDSPPGRRSTTATTLGVGTAATTPTPPTDPNDDDDRTVPPTTTTRPCERSWAPSPTRAVRAAEAIVSSQFGPARHRTRRRWSASRRGHPSRSSARFWARTVQSSAGGTSNVWARTESGHYVANVYVRGAGIDPFNVKMPCP